MANLEDDLLEPKKPKTVPILIGVIVLLLAGGGGFFAYTQSSGDDKGGEGGAGGDGAAGGPVFVHEIKGLLVNLNDPSGDRYLRTTIVLKLASEAMAAEVVAKEAEIRDILITYLSALRFAQTQGAKGKEQIRRGIKGQIDHQLRTGKLSAVFFTDFVVQ